MLLRPFVAPDSHHRGFVPFMTVCELLGLSPIIASGPRHAVDSAHFTSQYTADAVIECTANTELQSRAAVSATFIGCRIV